MSDIKYFQFTTDDFKKEIVSYFENKPIKEAEQINGLLPIVKQETFTEAEINTVLAYLAQRPYIEVVALITNLSKNIKMIVEEPSAEVVTEKPVKSKSTKSKSAKALK